MERQKNKPALRKPKRIPLPSSSSLAEQLQPDPTVRIIFGASVQDMPLAGLTVERARELAATILSADRESPVLVNGRPGRAGQVLAAGDVLEIVHHAGEKGALRWMCGSR